MRLIRKRSRLRPLDERECYLRLHGRRSGDVEIVDVARPRLAGVRAPAPPDGEPDPLEGRPLEPGGDPLSPAGETDTPPAPEHAPAALGPTDAGPALHLLIAYPRNRGRLTGEELRRDLLRRMEARAHEAA